MVSVPFRERYGAATEYHIPLYHINGVKTDNRLENLELWSTHLPSGQRIEDLLEYSWVILERHGEEFGCLERV